MAGIKKDHLYDKDKTEFYPITAFEYILDASDSGSNVSEEYIGYRAIKNNIGKFIDDATPTSDNKMKIVMTDGTKLFKHSTQIGGGTKMSFLSAGGGFIPFSSTYFSLNNSVIEPNINKFISSCEKTSNKVTSFDIEPTDDSTYPSAKLVYDALASQGSSSVTYQTKSNMQKSSSKITASATDDKYPSSLNVYNFLKDNGAITLVDTTYSALMTNISNSALQPGRFYRITDYVTTYSSYGISSAGKPFDVIVLALTTNSLSEDAWAARNTNDSNYFSNTDFSRWRLKYITNNSIYNSATYGITKGFIYYMKDEFGNEAPYDFKNIQFTDSHLSNKSYTFSYVKNNTVYDLSMPNSGLISGGVQLIVRNNVVDNMYSYYGNKITPIIYKVIISFNDINNTDDISFYNNIIKNSVNIVFNINTDGEGGTSFYKNVITDCSQIYVKGINFYENSIKKSIIDINGIDDTSNNDFENVNFTIPSTVSDKSITYNKFIGSYSTEESIYYFPYVDYIKQCYFGCCSLKYNGTDDNESLTLEKSNFGFDSSILISVYDSEASMDCSNVYIEPGYIGTITDESYHIENKTYRRSS